MIPPGSPYSVIFGTGITSAAPGSAEGLQLGANDRAVTGPDLVNVGWRFYCTKE